MVTATSQMREAVRDNLTSPLGELPYPLELCCQERFQLGREIHNPTFVIFRSARIKP